MIAGETSALGLVAAAAAGHLLLPGAPSQTSGQLRAAAQRAVAFTDPTALAGRREQARTDARVEVWAEPSGTSALAGRDLPPASALAASTHLTALASQLQQAGAEGTIGQLRAHAYTALLAGQPPAGLLAMAQQAAPRDATTTHLPAPATQQEQPPAAPPRSLPVPRQAWADRSQRAWADR